MSKLLHDDEKQMTHLLLAGVHSCNTLKMFGVRVSR